MGLALLVALLVAIVGATAATVPNVVVECGPVSGATDGAVFAYKV